MRIEYSKKLTDGRELAPFLSLEEPQFVQSWESSSKDKYLVAMKYDLPGLEKSLVSTIENNLRGNNFKTTRSGNRSLWVSTPDKFSLYLESEVTNNNAERLVKKNTRPKREFIFTRQIPVFWEAPSVDVSGEVCYEAFEGVEPAPVLDVLNKLGYAAVVIPTPEELREAIEKLKVSRRSSSSDDDESHYHDSDDDTDPLNTAAGIAIGTVISSD